MRQRSITMLSARCCHHVATRAACQDACVSDLDSKTWLTYTQAAKRVKSSGRTIRRWRRAGMPMQWRTDSDGQRVRVVDEQVLLKWWRRMMQSNVIHQSNLRRIAREDGLPVPAWHASLSRSKPRVRPNPFEGLEIPGERLTQSPAIDPADVDLYARQDMLREVVADLTLKAGGPEYYALQEALKTEPSACDGITAFTDTTSGDAEHAEFMESICLRCPVLELCRAFADAARPPGFWAGQRWPQKTFEPARPATHLPGGPDIIGCWGTLPTRG